MVYKLIIPIIFIPFYLNAQSRHSFTGHCPIPDTGQTVRYSTATGDDSNYQPAGVQMSYRDNGDCTITDLVTGLMWSKCGSANQTCSGGACVMTTTNTYTWENAITACEDYTMAGYNDWRLPNIKELFSLVRYSGSAPYIDSVFSCVSGSYWSSTTYVPYTTYAMLVYFVNGYANFSLKTNSFYVRCVRAGP